jgi:hypothetical protein
VAKTIEQRRVELDTILKGIDEKPMSSDIPKDVVELAELLDGQRIADILKKSDLSVNKVDLRPFETKKGKTMFEIFTTGQYGTAKINSIGNRLLKARITLLLE